MKKVIPSDSVLVPDDAKNVFEGVIFDVYQWQLAIFDGSESTWEMIKRPDTTAAICVIDGKILVIEEEQPHSGGSIAFPGGRADVDDTVLDAIKREVAEEVGYKLKNWRLINVQQPHTKIEWFVHIFLAWDVESKSEINLDPGEKIVPKLMSFDEVKLLSQGSRRYINESSEVFKNLNSLEDLLAIPEFKGQEVDR